MIMCKSQTQLAAGNMGFCQNSLLQGNFKNLHKNVAQHTNPSRLLHYYSFSKLFGLIISFSKLWSHCSYNSSHSMDTDFSFNFSKKNSSGLNYVPPNSYVEILAPSTPKYDLFWRQSLYRGNQVKVKSLGWPPSNTARVLTKRRKLDTEIHIAERDRGRRDRGRRWPSTGQRERRGTHLSLIVLRRNQGYPRLNFRPLISTTSRQ